MPGHTRRSILYCVSPPPEATPAQATPPDRDGIRGSYANSCDEFHLRWHPATLQEPSTRTRSLQIASRAAHVAAVAARPRVPVRIAVDVRFLVLSGSRGGARDGAWRPVHGQRVASLGQAPAKEET